MFAHLAGKWRKEWYFWVSEAGRGRGKEGHCTALQMVAGQGIMSTSLLDVLIPHLLGPLTYAVSS
jgi:hypothetical protein